MLLTIIRYSRISSAAIVTMVLRGSALCLQKWHGIMLGDWYVRKCHRQDRFLMHKQSRLQNPSMTKRPALMLMSMPKGRA